MSEALKTESSLKNTLKDKKEFIDELNMHIAETKCKIDSDGEEIVALQERVKLLQGQLAEEQREVLQITQELDKVWRNQKESFNNQEDELSICSIEKSESDTQNDSDEEFVRAV